jgi:Flp pilus assembly protein TadD
MALPLGACSSFLGIHFARHTPRAQPVEALAASVGASTAAGRAQLADGEPGQAIESFQHALTNGEPQAAALNGLGVAYARLSRDDLAERFFREAMAADPANTRYADNLTLLMRSPSFAARNAALLAAQASLESTQLLGQPKSNVQTAEPQKPSVGQLQRVSRAEVHIVTAPAQATPLRTASAKGGARLGPLPRVVIGLQEPKDFKPLVRFELPKSKPVDSNLDSRR